MRLRPVVYIIIAGLAIRILFYLFGAKWYYGEVRFYVQGDTLEFFAPFYNLLKHGVFTTNLDNQNALYGRMPGYPFLIGFFYLLAGQNLDVGFKWLVWFQILFDSFIIYIIYKTAKNIFNQEKVSLLAALLYAFYPFIIVWTVVVYAECIGVNLAALSVYFSSQRERRYALFWSGAFAALATFFRPQLIFLTSSIVVALFLQHRFQVKALAQQLFLYAIGFFLIFTAWPVRNYLHSGEIILTKKPEGISRYMSPDRLNFAYFMWAIKTDWEPQITQLIQGQEVEFPAWVWRLSVTDSIKLRKALKLSSECADGFAQLKRLPKIPEEQDCTQETARLWEELRKSVIQKAPLRFFLLVPLGNLKKAFFKTGLIRSYNRPDKPGYINVLASVLFVYRSLLLMIGWLGLIRCKHEKNHYRLPLYYLSAFFVIWYLYLCFVYRDMDMRYLLPADALLLIPAAWSFQCFLAGGLKRPIRNYLNSLREKPSFQIGHLVILGLLIRAVFFFVGAKYYFGTNQFYIQGDTFDFFAPFANLLKYGTFTLNFDYPDAVMGREPGFSFVMGFFYLLAGKDVYLALHMILLFQILLDAWMIIIVYKISFQIFNSHHIALLAALFYALYPFIIVWTSVVYAETFGVHACLLSVYFAGRSKAFHHILLAGIFAAIGTFLRPQVVFLTVAFIGATWIVQKAAFKAVLRDVVVYSLGFFLIYVWWPIRNFINYGEITFFKKVEHVARSLSHDQLNFAYFMWAVKTDWEPQISQLLFKKEVEMPAWVWKMSIEDSIKLRKALELSDQCADGFAQLRGQPKLSHEADCTDEVARLWKELRKSVIKHEPLRFYLLVPLSNLKKAFFKTHLIQSFNRPDKSEEINLLVFFLFLFRTILLLSGFAGSFIFLLQGNCAKAARMTMLYILLYAAAWYFYLSFVYRDMDMRYLLPADVLLLIPAAYCFVYLQNLFSFKSLHTPSFA